MIWSRMEHRIRLQRERRDHRALPGRAELDRYAAAPRTQRPENAQFRDERG
jgi:hypothetical protein